MSSFRLETHRAVRKDLKKIASQAAKEIVNEIFPLVGVLREYFKFIFYSGGVNYRIIYQIDKQRNLVFILAVGAREKFYERLLRRLR